MKNIFEHKLLQICKDFLETHSDWSIPTTFELDGFNFLQAFQKDGYNMGIVQNKYDTKIWTFVYRKKIV